MDAFQPNKKEIDELVSEYERRTGRFLKALILISDGVVWVVETFMGIVSGIFGNIWGAGLIGIVIVLAILFALLVVWVYALFIIVPLINGYLIWN